MCARFLRSAPDANLSLGGSLPFRTLALRVVQIQISFAHFGLQVTTPNLWERDGFVKLFWESFVEICRIGSFFVNAYWFNLIINKLRVMAA